MLPRPENVAVSDRSGRSSAASARVSASAPRTRVRASSSSGSRSSDVCKLWSSGGSGAAAGGSPTASSVGSSTPTAAANTACAVASEPAARMRATSNRVRSASARVSSIGACRPLLTSAAAMSRCRRDRAKASSAARWTACAPCDREVRLLDQQLDAQPLGVGVVPLGLVGDVGDRGLGGDAAEVEDLLRAADRRPASTCSG